ncbi:hypothetical protein [Dyella sp. EPa41]|uniref:hypothetical protein n=1 Tax=Dyella sp. EPa41 TaxID=1561194 RepID=UPI0019164A7C|nr:hypothetical protein [Dyella sp. EPa41]
MAFYLLIGAIASTFVCVSVFLACFLLGGKRFAEKGAMEYENLTLGNPLNALFIDRLLTDRGLRLRRLLLISIGGIWGLCIAASIVVTNIGN